MRLAGFRVNIFYIFSLVCTLVLVGYFWFTFLPLFEGSYEYASVRIMIGILTALLLAVAAIQVFLAIRKEKEES